MKKQHINYSLPAFRFRRWSRKRYAAFISRQRAFTMGTLKSNVVERLQNKTGCVVKGCICMLPSLGEAEDAGLVGAGEVPDNELFFIREECVLPVRMQAIPAPVCNTVILLQKRKVFSEKLMLSAFVLYGHCNRSSYFRPKVYPGRINKSIYK